VDSVARIGPAPIAPATGSFIGADPVTGRQQQIDFQWRPLADIYGYDLLIAKDVNFTLILNQKLSVPPTDTTGAWTVRHTVGIGTSNQMYDVDNITGAWIITPADEQQPGAWIGPGVLEVGRPYYWRVRGSRGMPIVDNTTIIETKIHSPWSPVMMFSVKPGFAVRQDYNGPILLTPNDGPCQDCKSPVRFSWSPVKNATKYEFVLSSDPELKQVITKTTVVNTTAFEYKDKLESSKPYYWQVQAISPVVSDASPVGTFTFVDAATAQRQQQQQQQEQQRQQATQKPQTDVPQGPSDFWIWIIIVIAMVLLILINIYAFISRSRN
jgi:hypothetical protein